MLSDTPSCSRYERTLIRRANAPGGRPARSPRPSHPGSLWCCLLICLLVSNGATNVRAVPVAQGDSMTTTTAGIITTGSTDTATPGAIISSTLAQTQSSSHSSALASSTTTTVPGTVVTDSPLVRTNPVSSLGSIFSLSSNQSSTVRSASGSANFPASSSSQSPTIYPSPTSDGDGNTSDSDATDSSTLNSLVNLYFLILGGAIAAALVGWWYWRRRRKGKHTRDRRRGLEALRRDLELGRLRRGFLGVVGRGGGGHSQNSSEELPAYQPARPPPSALTRPPGYNETAAHDRRGSNHGLHTIQEEGSITSRSHTPDIANSAATFDLSPAEPMVSSKDVN